jgi:hypothetical protein
MEFDQTKTRRKYSALDDIYYLITLSKRHSIELIVTKIVEAIKRGEKVYFTERAAKLFKPLLEKYGITLLPAERIESKAVIIDVSENQEEIKVFARQHRHEEWKEKRYSLREFVEAFRKELEKAFRKKKKYNVFIISDWM